MKKMGWKCRVGEIPGTVQKRKDTHTSRLNSLHRTSSLVVAKEERLCSSRLGAGTWGEAEFYPGETVRARPQRGTEKARKPDVTPFQRVPVFYH